MKKHRSFDKIIKDRDDQDKTISEIRKERESDLDNETEADIKHAKKKKKLKYMKPVGR